MKLQRSTLILLLVAFGLAGVVYLFEIRVSDRQEQIAAQKEKIFTFSADDVQSFTVTIPNQTVTVERVEENNTDSPSPWRITSPVETLANPASVNLLMNQLLNSQTDQTNNTGLRQLTIPATELSNYGLDDSQTKVEIILKKNRIHRLSLGELDFNQRSVYGKNEHKSNREKVPILVIPKEILTAVEQPLEDWKLPETANETVVPKSSNSQEAESSSP
jgi:hypothetical protein